MIHRAQYLEQITLATQRSPITALLGPRQCGKTTLARMFGADKKSEYFDLESEPDVLRLQNPELVLGSLSDLVIIDEIQRMPSLFSVLRVLVDRRSTEAHFLILGSASPDLVKNASETLAGRIEFIELSGFDIRETGPDSWQNLWLRGGFPRSFLSDTDNDSLAWREGFMRTFLERDIPQLGIGIPSAAMRRFWTMLAHSHGQLWNASDLARSMGLTGKTVRSYLDILSGTFMIRQLQPWYEHIGKRQVKSPKIFFTDTGILHALLDISELQSLYAYSRVGASWEGFALQQFLQIVKPAQTYFWSTYRGAEIDLFFLAQGRRYGVECKFHEAPRTSKSMHIAIQDLDLDHLWVLSPGRHRYPVHEKISVLPIHQIPLLAAELKEH